VDRLRGGEDGTEAGESDPRGGTGYRAGYEGTELTRTPAFPGGTNGGDGLVVISTP
jgi:hypothetical protein